MSKKSSRTPGVSHIEETEEATGMKMTSRQRKLINKTVVYSHDDVDVTLGMVRRAANLKSTQQYFGKDNKEDLLKDIDAKDIAKYVWEKEKDRIKRENIEAILEDSTDNLVLSVDEVEKEIETILAKYLATYEVNTPNDLEALRALASMDVHARHIRRAKAQWMENTDPSVQRLMKALTQQELELYKASREHQKMMQVDPKSREEARGARRADQIIQEIIMEAKDILKNEILVVSHCGIVIGWVAWFFPSNPFSSFVATCPRCGKRITVSPPDSWADKAVEASDFPLELAEWDTFLEGEGYTIGAESIDDEGE